jgi:hypothetical protein
MTTLLVFFVLFTHVIMFRGLSGASTVEKVPSVFSGSPVKLEVTDPYTLPLDNKYNIFKEKQMSVDEESKFIYLWEDGVHGFIRVAYTNRFSNDNFVFGNSISIHDVIPLKQNPHSNLVVLIFGNFFSALSIQLFNTRTNQLVGNPTNIEPWFTLLASDPETGSVFYIFKKKAYSVQLLGTKYDTPIKFYSSSDFISHLSYDYNRKIGFLFTRNKLFTFRIQSDGSITVQQVAGPSLNINLTSMYYMLSPLSDESAFHFFACNNDGLLLIKFDQTFGSHSIECVHYLGFEAYIPCGLRYDILNYSSQSYICLRQCFVSDSKDFVFNRKTKMIATAPDRTGSAILLPEMNLLCFRGLYGNIIGLVTEFSTAYPKLHGPPSNLVKAVNPMILTWVSFTFM